MNTRKVVITLIDGTSSTHETNDNPFEIDWNDSIRYIRFYLNGIEVGTIYRKVAL